MAHIDILLNNKFVSLWDTLSEYRNTGIVTPYLKSKEFENKYLAVSEIVNRKVYEMAATYDGLYAEYVGGDDGHDDLADFIIWHGRDTVENFFKDPKSVIILAEKMSKHEGFDGDINIIRRIIYGFPPVKKTQSEW